MKIRKEGDNFVISLEAASERDIRISFGLDSHGFMRAPEVILSQGKIHELVASLLPFIQGRNLIPKDRDQIWRVTRFKQIVRIFRELCGLGNLDREFVSWSEEQDNRLTPEEMKAAEAFKDAMAKTE